jgi:hypothetical protein
MTRDPPGGQSIARRMNPQMPIAEKAASQKTSATTHTHARMWGTYGTSAPRMPSPT